MQYFLHLILFFIFSQAGIAVSHRDAEAEQFFADCPSSSRCGDVNISFPLSRDSSPSYCSPLGTLLSCTANNTLVLHNLPQVGPAVDVTAIRYDDLGPAITIKFSETWASCPLRKLSNINLNTSPYNPNGTPFVFLNCSTNITLNDKLQIAGPYSCLSDADHFVYVAYAGLSMDVVPSGCDVVITNSGMIPFLPQQNANWGLRVQTFTQLREFELFVRTPYSCRICRAEGKPCVYSQSRDEIFCFSRSKGPRVGLIIGVSVGGLVMFTVVAVILFYKLRKSDNEKEILQKVEKFLETYNSTAPTRYTFSEVVKIAGRFKHKLGQGGYGSVYKGQLPNGIPVAVKVLEKFKGEGEEFINEVATIGRIHHFNIVRLLGFCSEGSRQALIYEFMPNESLEKHIFTKVNGQNPLSIEVIQDIAIGIAQGMEYLHQGCDQRILHFDIKPHNILLDYNFKPKIADFGLSKLCSKEQSIVSMTAVRGTMGYIAPELYSRNFGTVSYKSDVYSFGMLLLEMTGRRRNIDPDVEDQSQAYFPEWVYDQLVNNGQELKVVLKIDEGEEAIIKKLVIVALCCIQWSPTDRPSMTKVLQMLTDDLQNLQIPPKPFVSSVDLS